LPLSKERTDHGKPQVDRGEDRELKQMASLGLAESEQVLGGDRRHRWSIPDRKIAMKYLVAVKGGMEPRQWAQLHPAEWERLIQVAPLKGED
jgi:hypothetical protein